MSEFQYVVFQAVDAPLNDEQMHFARQQSSRAEVSRWSLSVEYHFSSFRGDVDGLLRRGFDVYLRHSNYGDRDIKLRLPGGMPCGKSVWSKYVDGEQLTWKRDGRGRGGTLSLLTSFEPGQLEDVWKTQPYLDAAIRVRQGLIDGDLRALYLLWLCAANSGDDDPGKSIEPPVPHGIADWAADGGELLRFFGLDPMMLAAAGSEVASAPTTYSERKLVGDWVKSLELPQSQKSLERLLVGDTASEKARLLAEIRDSRVDNDWPTTDKRRSLAALTQTAKAMRAEHDAQHLRKAQATAERQRRERMKVIREDPDKWLRETDRLVAIGGTANYLAAADILHDLRQALGGHQGETLARRQAAKLVKKHPTRNRLKSSFRKRGLLA